MVEEARLVLLRLGPQARDTVVAEGLRVLVQLAPRLGGHAAFRGGRRRGGAGRRTLRLER